MFFGVLRMQFFAQQATYIARYLQINYNKGLNIFRALLLTLDFLRWRRQEEKKPRNQNFKVAPASVINFGHTYLSPGTFLAFIF